MSIVIYNTTYGLAKKIHEFYQKTNLVLNQKTKYLDLDDYDDNYMYKV